ncbi:MAG: NYN domain-containing protein [Eggerthellaceae bacterium]|nr:NYN domain-containing protein [Eggerthellaceae bacterium]
MEPKLSLEGPDKRFALLIDADNVSSKYIKPILDELSKYGTVTYKRIYGDWTLTLHAKWKDALLENSITPIQQFSYTYGKNATDSAMIIDAMDILYEGKVDGFCLVSSDSDFTRLASRLRESGLTVIGMGEKKTPTPFRRACDIFTTLELLVQNNKVNHSNVNNGPTLPISDVEQAVVDIITDNSNNGKATGLGEVGSRLLKRYPEFDVRSYGTNLLSKLLEDFTRVVIKKDRNNLTVELAEAGAPKEEPEPAGPQPRAAAEKPEGAEKKDKQQLKRSKDQKGKKDQKPPKALPQPSEAAAEEPKPAEPEEPRSIKEPAEVREEPSNKPGRAYRVRRSRASKEAKPVEPEEAKPVVTEEPKPEPEAKPAKAKAPKKTAKAAKPKAEPAKPKQQTPASFIQSMVDKAGANGMNVADVGNALRGQFKNFKVKDLGYPRLATYLQEQPLYRLERKDGVVYVFSKSAKS